MDLSQSRLPKDLPMVTEIKFILEQINRLFTQQNKLELFYAVNDMGKIQIYLKNFERIQTDKKL